LLQPVEEIRCDGDSGVVKNEYNVPRKLDR
jgi:hypothetical protein